MESSLWATMGKGIIIQALNHLGLKMQPILFGRISMQHCPNYMFGKIWERSSRIQMSSIFANLKDLKKTRSRPGPSRDVASLCSMRSFLWRANLFHTTFFLLEMIPSGGNAAKEHIFWTREFSDVYLMSTSENSIYCLSYPVLSYHFRHHPSTIHSASHRRTVTNLPNVKKYPIWSFKHDKCRKKISTTILGAS